MQTNIRILITDVKGKPVPLARVEIFHGEKEIRGFTSADGRSAFQPDESFANRVLRVKVSKEGFNPDTRECTVTGEEVHLNFLLQPVPITVDHTRRLLQWWPLVIATTASLLWLHYPLEGYGYVGSATLITAVATWLLASIPIYIGMAVPVVLSAHLLNVLLLHAKIASTQYWIIAFIISLNAIALLALDRSRAKLRRFRFIRQERIRASWQVESS